MTSTCPHCGAKPHESRKRVFACGTTYSGSGAEYRTEACKLTEAANEAREAMRVERDHALGLRDQFQIAMELAQQEAARDRDLAVNAQKYVDEETARNRASLLNQVKTVLFPETEESVVC